jgi:hypothetical protein
LRIAPELPLQVPYWHCDPDGHVPSPGITQGAGGGQSRLHVAVPSALQKQPYCVLLSGHVPTGQNEPALQVT